MLSNFCEVSKISFSLEMLLEDFSYWLPKARNYGYSANELYVTDDSSLTIAIPIPILDDGNYRLWLFHFCRVEKVTPRGVNILIAEMNRMFDEKLGYLVHFRHYYIITDRVTKKIPPRCSRMRSVYVIKADYAFKVYEIIAKAVDGFVKSFRKNVRYGEDLLNLCDELQLFAEKMKRRAGELKSLERLTIAPTRNFPVDGEEARNYIALLEKSRKIE